MENPTDSDNESNEEIVVGKTSGSGIKITYITFDYSSILSLQNETNNVWIYDSNIVLKLKSESTGEDPFIQQITEIHPLLVDYTELLTATNISSQTGIADTTGEFPARNNVPNIPRTVVTSYTDTIHTYISPSGSEYNEDNYGIVLISHYTDGSIDENTDSQDLRYYGLDEDNEEYVPYIDVCYKVVEIQQCEEGEIEIIIPTADDVKIVEDKPDKNFDDKDLVVGTDLDDGTSRALIKFNSETFDSELYNIESITKAWIYITFDDFTEGTEDDRTSHTINIKTITEEWSENNATWNSASDISSDTILATIEIPYNQPGKTQIVVPIETSIQDLLEETHGIMLVNDDETTSSRVPEFINKDTSGSYTKPTLHVCVPPTTTSTTTPSPTQTVTPTYTSSTSLSTTTQAPPMQNCTIPDGGKRVTIDLSQYVVVQDTPLSANDNEAYIEIGQTSDEGEKVLIMYFDMEQAIQDAIGTTDNVAVTDSRINFRLNEPLDGDDDTWVAGRPILYPLKSNYDENSTWSDPWILEDSGPTVGVDYYSSIMAKFPKLNKVPESTRWLQAVTTTIVRYVFTETTYKKQNHGFVIRYVTEDGTAANHMLTFDSPSYQDDEFHPYMDICYLEVEPPITCDEGTLVYYEINADTYIMKDGIVHGSEEHLYVGNSGWDGNARILVDFDMSTVSDLVELMDDSEAVYLRMWYEGAEMGKPYNDPKQMDRTLAAHKILKTWSEDAATNKIATSSGATKNKWGLDMMDTLTDYSSDIEDSDTIQEGEGQNNFYFNLTEVFLEWRNHTSSDYGVVIKDNWHESVPGYFLKFASNDNSDPTKRPYIMACQKQATCEPVDSDPITLEDGDGCVSIDNVTLNTCVAKNGGCEMDDEADNYDGYYYGVTALWNTYHELITFCKCCIELDTADLLVPMDCQDATTTTAKPDYDKTVSYITECGCQACSEVSSKRKKRAAPSKTRLLLRSALKSMLRK